MCQRSADDRRFAHPRPCNECAWRAIVAADRQNCLLLWRLPASAVALRPAAAARQRQASGELYDWKWMSLAEAASFAGRDLLSLAFDSGESCVGFA